MPSVAIRFSEELLDSVRLKAFTKKMSIQKYVISVLEKDNESQEEEMAEVTKAMKKLEKKGGK